MQLLDAAFLYARHGLHVIPVWQSAAGICTCPKGAACVSPGKHPVGENWQRDASTDARQLRSWFTSAARNIGIVCSLSAIAVVDVDPRNGGDVTLAALERELGALPLTVTADTGGGGEHRLFRRPDGDLVSSLGKGIDFKRDGGQIVVEPSIHPSGTAYRWRADLSPADIEIAELPPAWISRVRRRVAPPIQRTAPAAPDDTKRYDRARAYLAKIPGAVAQQGGHLATFNATAAILIGFDLSEQDALSLLASDYNPRCSPPWNERELQHKITSVGKQCQRERGYLLVDRPRVSSTQQAAQQAPDSAPIAENWQSLLTRKKDTSPKRGYANTATYVRHHPDYRGQWSIDLMTGQPWFAGALMRPGMVHEIRAAIDVQLGFTPQPSDVEAAILAAAHDREFHPIKQYLRSLDWDGTPRLYSMASDYLGSTYQHHAEMVRKFMIGAAARVLRPGCKLDTALMLVGAQGIRKSTFFATLGGAWHSDTFVDITDRDGLMQIHSAWIYELAELENVVQGRAESRLKAWMTSSSDMYRAPYERTVTKRPRSVVICGTTNRGQFLTDDTGSRRFWIIPVEQEIPWQLLADNRDQLWAEAVCAVEAGEPWWLDAETDEVREQANAEHTETDSWLEPIYTWLDGRHKTSVGEVLTQCLKIEAGKHDRAAQTRAGRALTAAGWLKLRTNTQPRTWIYCRP